MNRRRPLLWVVVLLVGLLIVVAWRVTTSGSKLNGKKERVITVGTMAPVRNDLDVRLSYTADIQPYQQVNIFSRVDGYIAKMHVDKGDFAKEGQLLVEVDHTDYVHAVNRAKANLAAARANVVSQEATIKNAKLNLARMQSLIKDQYVSQQDADNAQAAYDVAVAQIDSLRAQVHQMEVALQQAETNLAYSYIRAPFPGYISLRNLDQGAFVSGSTGSTSTFSRGILVLQDITTVRVLIDVVEKDVPLVKIGQPADLRADAYPGRVFTGKVTRVVQALDRNTRTMTVEVDIPNPDRALKGGMFARVELVAGTHVNALQIPIDAVTRLESDQYVFVVQEGKARKVPVALGIQDRQMVEVTKGLTGIEPVIVSGKDLVTDGAKVDPRPMAAALKPAPQK
ncbi:MAG: efflux RND transporter periplasmic adaptor subunit [Nitrospiraceae bacterium]|nr:MAG: efflux RND transporter periplasmic adaptor subunit [Nitrospiraceae bacterium]